MQTVSVSTHTRRKPFAAVKEAKTAQLTAEVEAHVDRLMAASMKTFALNVWRAAKAGKF